MKALRRIWDDLRKGENIDLYLTIAAAVAFVALNLAGVASTALLAPLTLAVLALLAVTSLGNRHRMDELLAQREQSLDDFFLEEFPPSYKTDLEAAEELWLVGVSLHRTVTANYALFERKLQQGHRLRVLLVHPDGAGLEMAVARGYTRRDVEKKRQEIRYVLDLLCDLRQGAPGRVEVRTIQHPLAYGSAGRQPRQRRGRALPGALLLPRGHRLHAALPGARARRPLVRLLQDRTASAVGSRRRLAVPGGNAMTPQADVLLVTVTKVETRAVFQAFRDATGADPRPEAIGDKTYHDLGTVNETRVWMAQSEMGAGGLGAAQQTVQKGIEALAPAQW